MKKHIHRLILPAALSLGALAPNAAAQKLGVHIGIGTRSGLSARIDYGRPSTCTPTYSPPSRRGVYARRGYGGHVHGGACGTVAGRYDTVVERVWVPEVRRRVWVPPTYETWYDACGTAQRRLVAAGCYRTVVEPGHFEERTRKVWVRGRAVCSSIVPR